jgi:hypothetical protein
MLFDDDFLSLDGKKKFAHQKQFNAGKMSVKEYFEREAVFKENKISTDQMWSDETYNWVMTQKMKSAIPQEPGLQDLGEEEGNYLQATRMGEKSPSEIKFDDGEIQSRRPVAYGQLNVQIAQDCNGDGSEIKILQLSGKGRISIPSHYRIEEIQARAKVTLWEATQLSKMYRILELPFQIVKLMNNKLANRTPGTVPWDVVLTGGSTLFQLAKGIKEVMTAPLENPEWAHMDCGSYSTWIRDDSAASFNSDFTHLDYDKYREAQWEQTNNVNLFTYWRASNIPTNKTLTGKQARLFGKAMSRLTNYQLSPERIQTVTAWVKKRCRPEQKKAWEAEVRRVAQIRAMQRVEASKIKVLPAHKESAAA